MDCYEVLWKKSAERDLRNIDKHQIPRIIKAVESLSKNPFPSKYRKLRDTERIYRIRIGEYRLIYEVDTDEKVITIYHIRHRKDAYRK
jgi:mRNA interferase RelE/StbE